MALPAPSPDTTALVTGASSGIGADIARELAKRGHGVTLVARREDRLRALADELASAHGIRAEVVAADLTDADARERLVAEVASRGLTVEILVNNAGFGTGGRFQEVEREQELRQVRVLCEATVDLTHRYATEMVARRRGAILIVASTAGMQPMPFSAGYSAAKAHQLALSEALHQELKPVGVTVTALAPGPVQTEFFDNGHPIGTMPKIVWVSSEQVARDAVDTLDAGRRIVVPGLPMRTTVTVGRYTPRWLQLRVVGRSLRRSL